MTDVAIIMGSSSDREVVVAACELLDELAVTWRLDVASAHRTPAKVNKIVDEAEAEGAKLFICAAGHAAHLAGIVAGRSLKPVIGIPVASSDLAGVDALYSTVMMPPGVPVATMAIGRSGAKNAAVLAAQILALGDPALARRLANWRERMGEAVLAAATERNV